MPYDLKTSTLCFPDDLKSCFACCPPIRPAGYEHQTHKNIIKRILRENTDSFVKEDRMKRPIRGYSCWALGYLDQDCRLPGCLLHPCRNDGIDLRYRVDYGEKCQREYCPEAKTFAGLPSHVKAFWVGLADGLDSFSYSSRRTNLLFRMMNWGEPFLHFISGAEAEEKLTGDSFLKIYPFFTNPLPPRGHAYLLGRLIDEKNLHWLKSTPFKNAFERFSSDLVASTGQKAQTLTRAQKPGNAEGQPGSHVHLLPLDRNFSDFLRLTLHVTQATLEEALTIKEEVDVRIEAFRKEGARCLNSTGMQS